VHLSLPALHDRLALVRVGELVADEHAVLVVLVGGDDVGMSRRPRQCPRRDAVAGLAVPLVTAFGRLGLAAFEADDETAVDGWIEIELLRLEGREALRQEK